MFTSRVRIIVLLFFIAGQRSRANPTTVAYPLETPPEQLKDHEAHEQIYEEKKGPEAHWDCQPGSDYIQEQISITTRMLSEGQTMIAKQKDMSTDEIVLVLGKAGSGKTSLVQYLTQNPKLQGKEVSSGTSEYIIEDGERIGTSVTESFTLYPEIVNYNNSSISFCDSPGFHDSRSSAHEIVSMDVMKSVTSKFKKVKILLLENYSALQHGISKDNFMSTLRHLIDFLGDVDRYKDHIVLIATKIPLKYITTDDINVVLGIVTEEMFIESIMKYLNQIEMSIAEKLNQKTGG
ncbi:uncharacterized protein LOC111046619 [Nilaparvata lugens]|uniref:uncharacterized protein LOC111046619 n=1 Tax=Nilaparvata lugens TaxID=108931 RepID=UPI00193E45BA|nr:uncharacterized protein LOC111046619 [Nilaparvata lugens]